MSAVAPPRTPGSRVPTPVRSVSRPPSSNGNSNSKDVPSSRKVPLSARSNATIRLRTPQQQPTSPGRASASRLPSAVARHNSLNSSDRQRQSCSDNDDSDYEMDHTEPPKSISTNQLSASLTGAGTTTDRQLQHAQSLDSPCHGSTVSLDSRPRTSQLCQPSGRLPPNSALRYTHSARSTAGTSRQQQKQTDDRDKSVDTPTPRRGSGSQLQRVRTPGAAMEQHRARTPPTPTDDQQAAASVLNAERRVSALHRRRFESVGRVITVDTSRAKSNQEVVRLCCNKLGWKEFPEGRLDGKQCHIYWHNVVYPDMRQILKAGTKCNRFPGMNELARKIPLTRTLRLMQRLFPGEFDFYPRSWAVPDQLQRFYDDFESLEDERKQRLTTGKPDAHNTNVPHNNKGRPTADLDKYNDASMQDSGKFSADSDLDSSDDGLSKSADLKASRPIWYIVKPDDGAQGGGIYLISSPDQLKDRKTRQVIQEYIAYPYLLKDNLKFDLRVYAVIKSLNPLVICVSREGMARFCTEQYNAPSASNQHQAFMHLTNYSLNKANPDYVHAAEIGVEGSKRLLSTVFHQMEARGVNTRKIWHNIKLLIVKTVLALVPELMLHYEHTFSGTHGPNCFHIIGFDILINDDLQPILLEINACPSLSLGHETKQRNDEDTENIEPLQVNSVVDEAIKVPLVRDALLLAMDELGSRQRTGSAIERSSSFGSNAISIDDYSAQGTGSEWATCLSEIFPARYQALCSHMLVLDKAAYLYMHFVNIRKTLQITMNGCRLFARKCRLLTTGQTSEIDTLYCDMLRNQHKPEMKNAGIPFTSFVEMLLLLGKRHFSRNGHHNLLASFNLLIDHCVTKLRHHGVRSARLRHRAITVPSNDQQQLPPPHPTGLNHSHSQPQPPHNNNNNVDNNNRKLSTIRPSDHQTVDNVDGDTIQEIYMLPARAPPIIWRTSAGSTRKRQSNIIAPVENVATNKSRSSTENLTLPKIRL